MRNDAPEMLILHEDAFYEFFRPYRHKNANYAIWGGLGLETFGEDLELVRKLPSTHVWTVIDGGDSADQWILPGIHTVNRVCFLVTEVPHGWKEIEFRIPSRGYSLSRLGLLRQTNKIERILFRDRITE